MKSHGCQSYYKNERDADLMSAYRRAIVSSEHIVPSEIYEQVVRMPSKRFWVSEERAVIVIARMLKGYDLHGMKPNKKDMFREIFRRVKKLRAKNPDIPLRHVVTEVVRQPAPCFYITPASARIMIYHAKKKWLKERQKKLRHLFM